MYKVGRHVLYRS